MNNERDCKHGQLARSCEICGLEAENAALKAELAATKEWSRLNNDAAVDMGKQCRELAAELAAMRATAKAMHDADEAYGCGFYDRDEWLKPYRALKVKP